MIPMGGILAQEQTLEYEPDESLAREVAQPTGKYNPIMALSELQRRKEMRDSSENSKQSMQTPSIAESIINPILNPQQQQNPMQMAQMQQQPQQQMPMQPTQQMPQQPRGFAGRGIVNYAAGGLTGRKGYSGINGSQVTGGGGGNIGGGGWDASPSWQFTAGQKLRGLGNKLFYPNASRFGNLPVKQVANEMLGQTFGGSAMERIAPLGTIGNPSLGLREFLEGLGIDTSGMTDQEVEQVAQEVQQQQTGQQQLTQDQRVATNMPVTMTPEQQMAAMNIPPEGIAQPQPAVQPLDPTATAAGIMSQAEGYVPNNQWAVDSFGNQIRNNDYSGFDTSIDYLQQQLESNAYDTSSYEALLAEQAARDMERAELIASESDERQQQFRDEANQNMLGTWLMGLGQGVAGGDVDEGLAAANSGVTGIRQQTDRDVRAEDIRGEERSMAMEDRADAAKLQSEATKIQNRIERQKYDTEVTLKMTELQRAKHEAILTDIQSFLNVSNNATNQQFKFAETLSTIQYRIDSIQDRKEERAGEEERNRTTLIREVMRGAGDAVDNLMENSIDFQKRLMEDPDAMQSAYTGFLQLFADSVELSLEDLGDAGLPTGMDLGSSGEPEGTIAEGPNGQVLKTVNGRWVRQ